MCCSSFQPTEFLKILRITSMHLAQHSMQYTHFNTNLKHSRNQKCSLQIRQSFFQLLKDWDQLQNHIAQNHITKSHYTVAHSHLLPFLHSVGFVTWCPTYSRLLRRKLDYVEDTHKYIFSLRQIIAHENRNYIQGMDDDEASPPIHPKII